MRAGSTIIFIGLLGTVSTACTAQAPDSSEGSSAAVVGTRGFSQAVVIDGSYSALDVFMVAVTHYGLQRPRTTLPVDCGSESSLAESDTRVVDQLGPTREGVFVPASDIEFVSHKLAARPYRPVPAPDPTAFGNDCDVLASYDAVSSYISALIIAVSGVAAEILACGERVEALSCEFDRLLQEYGFLPTEPTTEGPAGLPPWVVDTPSDGGSDSIACYDLVDDVVWSGTSSGYSFYMCSHCAELLGNAPLLDQLEEATATCNEAASALEDLKDELATRLEEGGMSIPELTNCYLSKRSTLVSNVTTLIDSLDLDDTLSAWARATVEDSCASCGGLDGTYGRGDYTWGARPGDAETGEFIVRIAEELRDAAPTLDGGSRSERLRELSTWLRSVPRARVSNIVVPSTSGTRYVALRRSSPSDPGEPWVVILSPEPVRPGMEPTPRDRAHVRESLRTFAEVAESAGLR